jgi:hypothetical protein
MPKLRARTQVIEDEEGDAFRRACRGQAVYAQRRCLRCASWFRSSGADHRRCDRCKRDLRYQSVEAIAC